MGIKGMRAQGARAHGGADKATVTGYRDLLVWQKAFQLSLAVYQVTRSFPSDERFGLTAQMRRAAVSIPSNIAEGYCRGSTRDYIRFLWIANGSSAELETQMLLSRELRLAERGDHDSVLAEVAEIRLMLRALIRSLERRDES